MDMNMDMDMSTMAATTTAAAMAMSTASSSMDMDSMTTMAESTLMTSSEMAMVFFQSMTTPLYSSAWTPMNIGGYAGTCIFLIALAVMHQVVNALKAAVFDPKPNPAAMSKVMSMDEELANDKSAAQRIASSWNGRPFHVATEVGRAGAQVVSGGIGYLLMLAVMTMNVGYFLSVLGGIFLGTFIAGRFSSHDM